MKFDIVIGNPPYQEEVGTGSIITGKKPIYQDFVLKSLRISSRFTSLIIPSRWVMNGTGLQQLYNTFDKMKHSFRNIVDYMTWDNAVFGESVQIAGGVMYFLIDSNYNGECIYKNIENLFENSVKRMLLFHPAFIRDNNLISIIHKVQLLNENTLNTICRTNTFSLDSYERGTKDGEIKLLTSQGWFGIHREKIKSNIQSIDKYKLAISGTTPGGGSADKQGQYKVLASIIKLEPWQVCTNTYITIGDFNTEQEVDNLQKYLKTKFIRALILALVGSIHIIPYSFTYVPLADFSVEWTDEKLYKKYSLSSKEISYIESKIKTFN